MIKDINFDLVGNLVTRLREKNGLTQQEFAKEIGVSKGAVCQWEQGSGIKTENLYDIATFFNITVSELIDGQLLEEDDDYFARNYNLDEFERFDEVDDSNYGDLLEYLKRCKNVIKRFMTLYPLHKEKELTKKQTSEYAKLRLYFVVDHEYAEAIGIGMHARSIDQAVEELTDFYGISDEKELDYTLYKLFSLKIKVNALSLLNYEKGGEALNDYFELVGKEYADELLTNLVSDMEDDEIETSLAIKRLVEFGAKCFFTPKHIHEYESNEIDIDVFKHLEGTVENRTIQGRYDFFKEEAQSNRLLERYNPYSWKNYTKGGYEYLIDYETTNRIRDIVLLKNNDPKTYYKNLLERDSALLLKKE